jgi:hypothetical protein
VDDLPNEPRIIEWGQFNDRPIIKHRVDNLKQSFIAKGIFRHEEGPCMKVVAKKEWILNADTPSQINFIKGGEDVMVYPPLILHADGQKLSALEGRGRCAAVEAVRAENKAIILSLHTAIESATSWISEKLQAGPMALDVKAVYDAKVLLKDDNQSLLDTLQRQQDAYVWWIIRVINLGKQWFL